MDRSMREISRVLKPGGTVYISEPVFAGDFNEILRLFHGEQKVREAAFNTVKKQSMKACLIWWKKRFSICR
jgi:hypothetical protein